MPADLQATIQEQQKVIDELHTRMQRYEVVEQNLRNTQSKLDAQIDTFTRIHSYTQLAFRQEEDLYNILAEGIVDIFQLELAAVLRIDFEQNALVVAGACNLPNDELIVPLPPDMGWLEAWNISWDEAICEVDPEWNPLNLHHVIYKPLVGNSQHIEGIILGGTTQESQMFYEFNPDEIKSSFMLYSQQMNSIANNVDALRQSKAAGLAKTRFLANLSHEIRTPMNAIIGMAQVAQRSGQLDEVMRCVGQINTSAHHLLGLLNDVLDISKVEEGKMSLGCEPFNLDEVLEALLSSIRPNAAQKNQNLQVNTAGVTHKNLMGDDMRLSQVLINLLSNAVKFTPEGGDIQLSIGQMKEEEGRVLLRFTVKDTGIGIADEMQASIFKPFEQGDNSISRRFGGTGLGLTISQRMVQLMGGTIQLQSQPGKGTTFRFNAWFNLNQAALGETAAPAAEDADFTGYSVLVVDDVEINRTVVRAFLQGTGIHIAEAQNGLEAVEMFSASAPGQYNVILMDLQMPVMDGFAATEKIRALPREDAKTVAILAMTANVFKEDVQQVMDAGMDGHIGKPVDYDVVIASMAKAIKKKA